MRTIGPWSLLAMTAMTLLACETSPQSASEKQWLEEKAAAAIERFKQADPSVTRFFEGAVAYAVFPSIGKGGAGLGGAYGKGVLYESGAVAGYCDMTQGTIGLQLGGQTYTEIVFFEDRLALQNFKTDNFALAASASAVAAKEGAAASANYENGVLVFTLPIGGLMGEAAVGGQNFRYEPK